MRRPFKIAVYFAVAFVCLLIVQSVLPRKGPGAPAVVVSFIGSTNSPPGMTLAVFSITNQASRSVKLWAGCTIEVEGRRMPLPSTIPFAESVIRPGRSLIAVIGIPPREARWRARWGVSWDTVHERILSLRDKWQVPVFLGGHIMYGSVASGWLLDTRRATIWRRTTDAWQIVYHQGTIAAQR